MDAHGCYKFNNADLALGPRDTTAHFPVFLRTTNFPAPDSITRTKQAQQKPLERKATKHKRRQCRRKPSLQHPDVLVPPLRENTVGAVFVSWPLPLVNLSARTCACFQHGVDEAGECDVAQQDHMSAHHLTPSAITREF